MTTPQEIIKEFEEQDFYLHSELAVDLVKSENVELIDKSKLRLALISTVIKQYKEVLGEVEGSDRAEKMRVNSFISPLESYRKEDQVYGYNLALSELRLSLQSKIKEWKLIDNK